MRKINYPLLVSDFDGTLVKKDGTISAVNRAAIQEYVAAGGKFVLSTGRMPSGILPRAKELGLKGVVGCCQGSLLVDIESGKPIIEGRLSLSSTIAVCKKLEELDLHIQVYDSWEYYSNRDDEGLRAYERGVGQKGNLVLDRPISKFVADVGLRSYKVLAMVRAEDNERVRAVLEAAAFEGCAVTRSSKSLVEVVNAYYSKGTALEWIAAHYGVPLEKTVAVGDQLNDLSMVARAGVGVAVGNADDGLKGAADYVCTRSVEGNAVAEVIEKFGFCKEGV